MFLENNRVLNLKELYQLRKTYQKNFYYISVCTTIMIMLYIRVALCLVISVTTKKIS